MNSHEFPHSFLGLYPWLVMKFLIFGPWLISVLDSWAVHVALHHPMRLIHQKEEKRGEPVLGDGKQIPSCAI
jgi:hypothetical protein